MSGISLGARLPNLKFVHLAILELKADNEAKEHCVTVDHCDLPRIRFCST